MKISPNSRRILNIRLDNLSTQNQASILGIIEALNKTTLNECLEYQIDNLETLKFSPTTSGVFNIAVEGAELLKNGITIAAEKKLSKHVHQSDNHVLCHISCEDTIEIIGHGVCDVIINELAQKEPYDALPFQTLQTLQINNGTVKTNNGFKPPFQHPIDPYADREPERDFDGRF